MRSVVRKSRHEPRFGGRKRSREQELAEHADDHAYRYEWREEDWLDPDEDEEDWGDFAPPDPEWERTNADPRAGVYQEPDETLVIGREGVRNHRPVVARRRATDAMGLEPEGQLSPGDIIARAAAIVPENLDPDSEKNSLLPDPDGWTEQLREMPRRRRRVSRPTSLPRPSLPGLLRWVPGAGARGQFTGRAAIAILVVGGLAFLATSDHLSRAAGWIADEINPTTATGKNTTSVKVERIEIKGTHNTSRKSLEAALGIRKGDNLMTVNLAATRERVRRLPWIAEAAVERRFSGVIIVRVREHQPIARFGKNGRLTLVGSRGQIIPVAPPARYAKLILVDGEGSAAKTPALMTLLKRHPRLAKQVVAARRFGRRRWDLRLASGAIYPPARRFRARRLGQIRRAGSAVSAA